MSGPEKERVSLFHLMRPVLNGTSALVRAHSGRSAPVGGCPGRDAVACCPLVTGAPLPKLARFGGAPLPVRSALLVQVKGAPCHSTSLRTNRPSPPSSAPSPKTPRGTCN